MMGGYGVFFTFITVGLALLIIAPIFALFGYLIFRSKHLRGRRGALWGALVPLLSGIIGLIPYLATLFASVPFDLQMNVGLYVPLVSIPIGFVVLLGMLIFVKPQATVGEATQKG